MYLEPNSSKACVYIIYVTLLAKLIPKTMSKAILNRTIVAYFYDFMKQVQFMYIFLRKLTKPEFVACDSINSGSFIVSAHFYYLLQLVQKIF